MWTDVNQFRAGPVGVSGPRSHRTLTGHAPSYGPSRPKVRAMSSDKPLPGGWGRRAAVVLATAVFIAAIVMIIASLTTI
jgi:hypothetical protein